MPIKLATDCTFGCATGSNLAMTSAKRESAATELVRGPDQLQRVYLLDGGVQDEALAVLQDGRYDESIGEAAGC